MGVIMEPAESARAGTGTYTHTGATHARPMLGCMRNCWLEVWRREVGGTCRPVAGTCGIPFRVCRAVEPGFDGCS